MIKKKSQQLTEVRNNMRSGPGQVTIRHYFKKDQISAPCRLCAQLEIPPGAGVGLHEHLNEDEVFIIQQGKALMEDDGKKVELEAGDAILTGKGASHSITNIGRETLLVTAVIIQYP